MTDAMQRPAPLANGWRDVPLPGLHNCLTWQFNVTLHPMLDTGKWVSILRDPDAQVELSRSGTGGVIQAQSSLSAALLHAREAVGVLAYLGGIKLG